MKFVLAGNPIPQARHRSFISGKRIVNYDPLSCEKTRVKREISMLVDTKECRKLIDGDFYKVHMSFYFPVPKSDSKTTRNAKLWGFEKHVKTPDCDNTAKFVLDCFKSVLFSDDSKVINLVCEKLYCENPRTEITITGHKMEENTTRSILELVSPHKFKDLSIICTEIAMLVENYGYNYNDAQEEAAQLLSELADEAVEYLVKINKKFPGFHKQL